MYLDKHKLKGVIVRKNMYIKVSGDLCRNESFFDYLKNVTSEYFVVICVGGGTQINEALVSKGIQAGDHGPMGRELQAFELRQLARNMLEVNQSVLQDELAVRGMTAIVTIPVIDLGSVLCHVNGDQMVRTAYIGFDKLVVVTTTERVSKKALDFSDLPKVEVVGLS